MLELRPYQQQAIDSVLTYWREGGGNPLVDMATGLGKSVVIAKLTHDLISAYPDMRVLQLVHVRELVMQNAQALLKLWPNAPLGIYSAGLGKRQLQRQITFASIQSVFRQDHYSLGPIDLVLIDEAHLVPAAGDGMYRKLLERLRRGRMDLRVCGFTATPFRLDSGRLDRGKDRLFDEVVYSYGICAGIEDGWLSPLISNPTTEQGLDVRGVRKSGGDFMPGALEAAVDQDPITRAAVAELVELGADRKSWLVFCAGVKHAHHVAEALRAKGISCATITGETDSAERSRHIADFKAGRLRALTNANVLTTGFDAPGVDLIAMLRKTLSTGLYMQMCGRGTRLAAGKDNCLVLDFAGNVRTHGPVDTVEISNKKGGAGTGEKVAEDTVRAKECPTCHSYSPLNAGMCKWCGHEWPVEVKPKHDASADTETPILSLGPPLSRQAARLLPVEQPVISWSAARHMKRDAPDSLKVTYLAGLQTFTEWLPLERDGWLRAKAEGWWRSHGGGDAPADVTAALARFGELKRPDVILTRVAGQYHEIVGRKFKQEEEKAA